MPPLVLSLTALAVLLVLSAFFSASETALFSLGKLRLHHLRTAGNATADTIEQLLRRPSRLLISILVGNMFVNIMASSLATILFASLIAHRGEWVAFAAMSLAILVCGEITPKFLAVQHPSRFSAALARPLSLFVRLVAPIVFLLEAATGSLVRLLEGGRRAMATAPTEDELMTVVELGHREGIVDPIERKMILRAFEFGNLLVSQVMTPRTEIFALDVHTPPSRARALLKERGFSRVPVYSPNPENIVGIVHAKDLVMEMFSQPGSTLRRYLRPAHFIPETKRLAPLLREFQRMGIHIAMVIDEHGALSGLVTLEDLLEEIVGEIVDRKERLQVTHQLLNARTIVVAGTMEMEELNQVFQTQLAHPDYKTVAGYLIGRLGRIPAEGESVEIEGLSFKILKATANRIIALRIKKSHLEGLRLWKPLRRV